jgi:hypothetical protein
METARTDSPTIRHFTSDPFFSRAPDLVQHSPPLAHLVQLRTEQAMIGPLGSTSKDNRTTMALIRYIVEGGNLFHGMVY